MISAAENRYAEGATEDGLVRRVYYLNTLYELNQEISTLKDAPAVLGASLLYLIGVFGVKRGLIVIYKAGQAQPHEFAYRGMHENIAISAVRQLKRHLEEMSEEHFPGFMREVFIVQDDIDSPLATWLKDYQFHVWLPLEMDEQTWGGIALGERLSEMTFTAEELELLSTIAINIQSVLNNVLLIEALHQSVIKETRIRNLFQRYAPGTVVNEVLNPSNEALLLGDSQAVRRMFDEMIAQLEEQHTLEQDLDLAHGVQAYLLAEPPHIPGIEVAARSIPARSVCGDFYDFISLNPYEVGVSLADVSGKGVSAAMIAMMLQAATRMCVGSYYPIPAILAILNRFMFRHTEPTRFATMFYAQVNAQRHTLTYSSAGHPPAMLCRNGVVQLLEKGGPIVGVFEQCSYDQETIELQPQDVLVIYSDGVTDAGVTPETDDAFGEERLEAVVVTYASLPAQAILDKISDEVAGYASGHKQFDDITLIIMKVDG